jgi:carboxyl-terminal processing protease
VREEFWDPKLKGVDWKASVARAAQELGRAPTSAERDAVYDRLLAKLDDSHTFRVPAGRLPARDWATAGLRIGPEGEGYTVKGVMPGSAAERAGLRLGDRVLAIDGKAYGRERVNFRDLFLVFEGPVGSTVRVTYAPEGQAERTVSLTRALEEPGDALVWRSARVIRKEARSFGYVRLWGLSAQTALAVVDLLLDREEAAQAKPELAGWGGIEGLLLDVRGNSGGYDPNILATFLRGRWSSGDYYVTTRQGRRLVPPEYRPLPVALLINSGTASAGESLTLQFRRHAIGAIVGEPTAGMASGGASAQTLSDGSTLWLSRRAIDDVEGRSYEGRGISPDVLVPDRLSAEPGMEEAVVEAAIRGLAGRTR